MKVLYADLEREWRGGQSQALLTLRGLNEQGHRAELLAAADSPLARRAADAGVTVHKVGRFALRLQAACALRSLIGNGGFELVHINEPHALTAAWLSRSHTRVPLFFSRRIGFPLWQNPISRARYAAVERFLASSDTVAQSLTDSNIPRNKITIVHEGVPIPPRFTDEERVRARKFWGIKEDEFLFGCVSVYVPEKGQRHLIEALPEVRAAFPGVRLLLPGDGDCLADAKSLAIQLNQADAVILPGFIQNVDQVYAALDAYAFPSEFEGLGTALLVAMAAGLPCISTRRGALKEVVDHDRTALVSEPSGKELAVQMLRLLRDESLRKRIGEAGRNEIEERFSATGMVAGTIRAYQEVLGSRQTS